MNRHIVQGLLALLGLACAARAQHCAPQYDSYLSEMSIRKIDGEDPAEDALRFHLQYAKSGGRNHTAYQGYLLAYLDRHADSVGTPPPEDGPEDASPRLFDPKTAIVLHTQVMERHEGEDLPGPWTYDLDFTIRCEELVKKVVTTAGLGAEDREEWTNWYHYKDRIRFAFFVPWLADERYSVLEGLPADRHECNYLREPCLLFQELSTRVQVLVSRSEEGTRGYVWLRLVSQRALGRRSESK